MEAENYGKEYLKKYQWGKEYGSYEDGCALLAARQLYDATGEEFCFSFVKNYMDGFLSADGELVSGFGDAFSADCVYCGRLLFFLYDKTGEEKYRKAIEAVMNGLRAYPRCECGNFVYRREQMEEISVDALYRIQPFYMEYETVYDKKERYNDIIKQFENVQKMICGGGEDHIRSKAQYLAVLVDTMENMSIEIYEQYRKLQDMFKQALKDVLAHRSQESGLFHKTANVGCGADKDVDIYGCAIIGYCVLKACRMGILLKEKYVDTGMEIVEKLMAKITLPENMACSTEEICASIMAYGQYLQTRE